MLEVLAHIRQSPLAKLVAGSSVDSAIGAHGVLLVQFAVGVLVSGAVGVLEQAVFDFPRFLSRKSRTAASFSTQSQYQGDFLILTRSRPIPT